MAAVGPFEDHPVLAIAVSGGADSLALAILAQDWARARGGQAIGLTVDHGLRPESAQEADQVALWLAERGIAHRILHWAPAHPPRNLQSAARDARYRLLAAACRADNILHLLTAHHQDDQAETLLLRLARGSGVDGLAAMAAISEQPALQLLRPLLPVPSARLRATLSALGHAWIDDPSNQSERFDRVRWRRALEALPKIAPSRLALTAAQMGRARAALHTQTAALSADAVMVHAAGFARLDPSLFRAAPAEIRFRLLAALCRTIAGAVVTPRLDSLTRLDEALCRGGMARRCLAGVVVAPDAAGGVLFYRESRLMPDPSSLVAETVWDGRFLIRVRSDHAVTVAALGPDSPDELRQAAKKAGVPRAVLPSLPALVDKHGILAVPPVGYCPNMVGLSIERWIFAPPYPLNGANFRLVTTPARTMLGESALKT